MDTWETVTKDTERADVMYHTPKWVRSVFSGWHENRDKHLRKGVRILNFYIIYTSLSYEKKRSFLFTRLDLLNRTDLDETVRNVEYML